MKRKKEEKKWGGGLAPKLRVLCLSDNNSALFTLLCVWKMFVDNVPIIMRGSHECATSDVMERCHTEL